MAYTPINWQTGDTITAEKMNKMDNGWGVSGGGRTLLCEETVSTYGDSPAFGNFTYSTKITAQQIVVTFEGIEYTCTRGSEGYGDYNFSTFPFFIDFYDGANELCTSSAGTYSVKIEEVNAPSVEVSQNFVSAVALQATIGETTYKEIEDALTAGRLVVIKGNGIMDYVCGTDNTSSPLEVYAISANSNGVNVSTFTAEADNSPIQEY